MLWTICHNCMVDEQFVHFFVDDMSGFGVDEQSVHFHVRWDAVLQWTLCTWVAKYSGLYM